MRTQPRCDNCRFWDESTEECRRYAPRATHQQFYGLCLALSRRDDEALEIVGNGGGRADFPQTHACDWCGEFEARPGVAS